MTTHAARTLARLAPARAPTTTTHAVPGAPAVRGVCAGGGHAHGNNYWVGQVGAGTFSAGKLTCRMTGADVDWVRERFVACGGKASIRYEHRPHLGSNRLPMLVRNFRRRIDALGGEGADNRLHRLVEAGQHREGFHGAKVGHKPGRGPQVERETRWGRDDQRPVIRLVHGLAVGGPLGGGGGAGRAGRTGPGRAPPGGRRGCAETRRTLSPSGAGWRVWRTSR